jgi:branched-chain amino acid transport system permease protein
VINVPLSVILSGLTLGAMYALVSSGLDLTFGVMNVINFAQGEFVMLGMYVTYLLYTAFSIDPFASLLITAPLGFVVGVLVQKLILNRTLGYPLFIQTVATFGLSLALQNSMLMGWGASYKEINFWVTSMMLTILGGQIGLAAFIGLVASLISLSLLYIMSPVPK